jgi:N-carbamoyl-L-amino-acid hydrolase
VALRALADSRPGRLHASVGRLLVSPNSSNVVPDLVTLTAEVRAADDDVLVAAEEAMLQLMREAAASAQVEVGFASCSTRLGRSLPAELVDFLEDCARAIGLPAMRLDTVAGHDALSFIGCCPTALVFVPSMNGVAHNEAEQTGPEDMDAGTALMLEAAFRLCRGDDIAGAPDRRPTAMDHTLKALRS